MTSSQSSRFFLFFVLAISLCGLHGQNLLTYDEFILSILSHHPMAKQADLQNDYARALRQQAKGSLDPTLDWEWRQKNFDEKLYYKDNGGQIKIPTSLGISVIGGYDNTSGQYLNPESKTDKNGLWNLGVEIDLLQGLLYNERKNALRQADNFALLAESQRSVLLNDLLYNATYAYLIWQQYNAYESILKENRDLASQYLENTKISFSAGEKTAIDTLEAFIARQDATLLLQKNSIELVKSRYAVSNFLWFDADPVTIQSEVMPQEVDQNILLNQNTITSWDSTFSNPIIDAKEFEISALEIEQRLNREKLKPKLKFKFNPLLGTTEESISPQYNSDNYAIGMVFSMPLLLRSERGKVAQGKIKIQEKRYDLENKRNELNNKIQASAERQNLLLNQTETLQNNIQNYRLLLDAESEKLRLGESSIFLLNKRQEKYISSQLKYVDTRTRYQMERLNFLYYLNRLLP